MNRAARAKLADRIADLTGYDARSIRFHLDGTVSGIKPGETRRYTFGRTQDYES